MDNGKNSNKGWSDDWGISNMLISDSSERDRI